MAHGVPVTAIGLVVAPKSTSSPAGPGARPGGPLGLSQFQPHNHRHGTYPGQGGGEQLTSGLPDAKRPKKAPLLRAHSTYA